MTPRVNKTRLSPGDGEKSAARFFYCPKASKSDRNDGCGGIDEVSDTVMTGRKEGSAGLDWNGGWWKRFCRSILKPYR